MTSSIVHARTHALTKLENELQDLKQLEGFEYFIKKFCDPVLQVLHYVAAPGGFITACQGVFWTLCIVKRTLAAFCKPPMLVQTDNKARAYFLLDLDGVGLSWIWAPLQRAEVPRSGRGCKHEEKAYLYT